MIMQFLNRHIEETSERAEDTPVPLDGPGRPSGKFKAGEILRDRIHQSPYWGYFNNIPSVVR
jgi:hypothetical protein